MAVAVVLTIGGLIPPAFLMISLMNIDWGKKGGL